MPQTSLDQLLDQSIAHHQAGRHREAEQGYRQVLASDPDNPSALNLLGVLAGVAGNPAAAVELIGRAAALRPADSGILNNYATALRQAGRAEEALEAHQRAVAAKEDPKFLMGLGDSYRQRQMFDQAIGCYRRAVQLQPNFVEALYAAGSTFLQIHSIEPAIAALQQAAQMAPHRPEIHRDLGIALHQLQRFNESAESCRRALEGNANDVLALSHLALSLRRLGRADEADPYLLKIVELPANGPAELFNRGLALEYLDRFEEATEAYRQALKFDPHAVPLLLNLGSLLQQSGKPDEAMKYFDKVAAMAPQFPLVHLDRAVVLLLKGNYTEGWKEYDWRWRCPERHPAPRSMPRPLWRGQDISGKTLLLHAEQGFGDAIQFVRYAPMASARGAKVIVEVPRDLVPLVSTLKGVERVIGSDEPPPEFDLHAPLMDLPMIFGTVLRNVPAEVPYLHADPAKSQAWAQRLAADEPDGRPALRVGLAWAGKPSHPFDRSRSIRLEQLAPLCKASDRVSFISLQKGPAARQMENPPPGLVLRNYAVDLHDFTDTAALLENLDLVISVDTSVVHLAGALARPVWVLVAVAPDWRWLEHRDTSPWYPTARIFRQQRRKEWGKVIEQVATELCKRADMPRQGTT